MRISEYLKLNKTQRELDFVDIDIINDTPLFIDPFLISKRIDKWSKDTHSSINNFFQYLISTVKAGDIKGAKNLFDYLREPKETGLGLSQGNKEGKGMGDSDTDRIFEKLINSKAIQSGLVEDLEDTVIFVEKIGPDKVSDMTTNIIRKHLVEYTQRQCKLLNIPLTADVPSGYFWNRKTMEWEQEHCDFLIIKGHKVLLVPKAIVCFKPSYTPQTYHQHFILNFLQSDHLRRNTGLVQTVVNRKGHVRKFVTKKSLKEKEAPFDKSYIRKFTIKNPSILEAYKKSANAITKPLDLKAFEDFNLTEFCDFLINRLQSIKYGNNSASEYHDLMIGLLDFLFYPELVCPQKEERIHDGRKRIDITFDNAAEQGFFFQLHQVKKIPCPYIIIECKNYKEDLKNPEIDQLSSRFAPNRGQFGIIACRQLDNEELFLKRCRDTYYDQRELVLFVTDVDITTSLEEYKKSNKTALHSILSNRMRKVFMS